MPCTSFQVLYCTMSFLVVDPQMIGAVTDWTIVPSGNNTLNSVVSSPTLVVRSVRVTCTQTPSHFSAPVSMISASTLQPMACCALLSQPMKEPVLSWVWTSLSGALLCCVVCLHCDSYIIYIMCIIFNFIWFSSVCLILSTLFHQLSQTPVNIWTAQSMSGVVRRMVCTAASVMSTIIDPTMRAMVIAVLFNALLHFLDLRVYIF